MKKLIYGISFLAIVGMIIVGCQKESTSNDSDISKTITTQKNDNLESGLGLATVNELNPYDYIGKYHNVILDELIKLEYSGTTPEIEYQIKLRTTNSISNYFPSHSQINLNELNSIPTFEGNYSDLDFENYKEIFLELKNINSNEANVIIDFIDECLSLNFTNNNINNNKLLIDIENSYITNHKGDFELFYLTSAVFRYSLIYNINKVDMNQELGRKWKLAIADAIGAGIGALAGGPIGALSGGAGASTIADHLLD